MSSGPINSVYLAAVLAFDEVALEALTRRITPRDSANFGVEAALVWPPAERPVTAPAEVLPSYWLALMRGEASRIEPDLERIFADLSNAREPHGVVEVTVLRALVELSLGKRAEGVAFARRAALMARSESLPAAELIANLVLARVRRHTGKPHLAVRIADAVARRAPELADGWLNWERLLAGGIGADAPLPAGTSPAARAVRAGREAMLAAREGQRPAFEHAASQLLAATVGFRDIHTEATTLIALLDFEREATGALTSFKSGDTDELDQGLFGAGVPAADAEPAIRIVATGRPTERGRRISCDGLGLFGPCRLLSADDGLRRVHGRTDAGLAVLVLWGPTPLSEEDFFRRVYGFAYSRRAHRGVLDVLVHRMRKRVGASGSVMRSEGNLWLDLHEAIAVSDPRCSPPAAARILSALAREPRATAESIAARLGITVRGAQMALRELVADGACSTRRRGRHLEYQLEDTTFSEPTDVDVMGAGASG
jgi:DNA-binding transcriptional ArsR family regulator